MVVRCHRDRLACLSSTQRVWLSWMAEKQRHSCITCIGARGISRTPSNRRSWPIVVRRSLGTIRTWNSSLSTALQRIYRRSKYPTLPKSCSNEARAHLLPLRTASSIRRCTMLATLLWDREWARASVGSAESAGIATILCCHMRTIRWCAIHRTKPTRTWRLQRRLRKLITWGDHSPVFKSIHHSTVRRQARRRSCRDVPNLSFSQKSDTFNIS